MRICIVFPATTMFENPMVYPPLGLFWIMAVLREKGHDVDYVDMSDFETDDAGDHVLLHQEPPRGYDVYMVGGTSPQTKEIIRIGRTLRERGDLVIAGGPHVTNNAGPSMSEAEMTSRSRESLVINPDRERARKQLLETFQVLVKHEGEVAVLEALGRLQEGQRAMERFSRGIVLERPFIPADKMDTIPIPDRRYANRYHCNLYDNTGQAYRTTTAFTARGCPERCAFCDSPALWGRAMRYTPMHRVIEEFEDIRDLGFRGVYFYDDILFLNKERTIALYKELKRFGFVSRGNLRVDIITHHNYGESFLAMLADHGLVDVFVGVESGDQRILNNIHKGTTVEQNTLGLQWCKKHGIKYKASVILGLPGETMESMEATRRWVIENRPDKVNVCMFVPFDGIPIVKGVNRARGITTTDADGRADRYGRDAIHDYDINFAHNSAEMEEMFFAGSRERGKMKAVVSTSALTSQQIQDFFERFVDEINQLGIPY